MKQTCCCRYLLSDRFPITHHLLLKGLFFSFLFFFPVTNAAVNPAETAVIWASESFCSRGTEKKEAGEGGWKSFLLFWAWFLVGLSNRAAKYTVYGSPHSDPGGNTRHAWLMGGGNQDGRLSVSWGIKANARWKDAGENPCEWHRFVTG